MKHSFILLKSKNSLLFHSICWRRSKNIQKFVHISSTLVGTYYTRSALVTFDDNLIFWVSLKTRALKLNRNYHIFFMRNHLITRIQLSHKTWCNLLICFFFCKSMLLKWNELNLHFNAMQRFLWSGNSSAVT